MQLSQTTFLANADLRKAHGDFTSLSLQVFTAVALGPLLGRGSYGRVHRGVWQEQQVAVKVDIRRLFSVCSRLLACQSLELSSLNSN